MKKVLGNISMAVMILFLSPAAALAFKVPDTGQMQCFNSSGNVISCANTGQDGAYTINPMSFTDNGNQTITDNNTGLLWQKCMAGRVNNATCDYPGNNVPYLFNWYQATGTTDATSNPAGPYYRNVCGELGSGWRLPTNLELMSIMDYSLQSPAIQAAYFPNTVNGLWTSLPAVSEENESWTVTLNGGINFTSIFYSSCGVRCVHGGQTTQSLHDNGNGTVTDTSTGLMWQQGEPGSMTLVNALNYCETLIYPPSSGYTDWRLPNIKELVSLVDYAHAIPAFNSTLFPNVIENYYWSSTPAISGGKAVGQWVLAPWDGELANGASSTSTYNVRCVRLGSGGGIIICPATAPVKIDAIPYSTVSAAYSAATDGQTIKMQATYFPEGELELTRNVDITLSGGYDCGFVLNLGGVSTILNSVMIAGPGSVAIENIAIK